MLFGCGTASALSPGRVMLGVQHIIPPLGFSVHTSVWIPFSKEYTIASHCDRYRDYIKSPNVFIGIVSYTYTINSSGAVNAQIPMASLIFNILFLNTFCFLYFDITLSQVSIVCIA